MEPAMAFSKAHPFFGHLFVSNFQGVPSLKRTARPWKSPRFSRWNSLIFGMFPYFQGLLLLVLGRKIRFQIYFSHFFSFKASGFQIALEPRYQASEEFVQESLGPGEILGGCWPYEGLIKGNQSLRSPDHKALFLGGGYVRGRVGWLAIVDVTFWTNHFRLDAVTQRLFQHTFGTHPETFTKRLKMDFFHNWLGGLPGVCSKCVSVIHGWVANSPIPKERIVLEMQPILFFPTILEVENGPFGERSHSSSSCNPFSTEPWLWEEELSRMQYFY